MKLECELMGGVKM